MRTAIATVCLSGTLDDKLDAAAHAGFDGVEIFENDLVTSPWRPEQIRRRCEELGLSIELYQPFRDFEAVGPEALRRNLRRAGRKFDLMERLGASTILVCSSVSDDAVDDDDLATEQLGILADHAAGRGMRIAYEALAWGRFVDTWDHSWRIVRQADHPALGLCLDSFHVYSRGGDPAGIAAVPGEKVFFVQLADAPRLDMGVLAWSRHHRLFPGQGSFDLAAFVGHVVATGYDGPLSLEVFNDVFRQSAPHRAAVDGMRSLIALADTVAPPARPAPPAPPAPPARPTGPATPTLPTRLTPAAAVRLPPAPELVGYAFVELAVDEVSGPSLERTLAAMGFAHLGQHRSKPVQLWQQGGARVLLNADGPAATSVSALAVETADPTRSARRAEALLAPPVPRTRGPAEADLTAVAAPDGTSVFFCRTGAGEDASWLSDFILTSAGHTSAVGITHVDHVALAQPFDYFDEATLFYRSVLGLDPRDDSEFAAPFGLARSRTVSDPAGRVRVTLNGTVLRRGSWAPGVPEPQYVAFSTDDVLASARQVIARGASLLAVSDNYYDDLDARLPLAPDLLAAMRECHVLYDRDAAGEYLHFHTELLGSRVFFQVVQRVGGYAGFGAVNSPVRMAAHRDARRSSCSRAV